MISWAIHNTDITADGLFPINPYVTDEEGNQDYCSTFVNIQDPNGGGPGIGTVVIGTIANENQEVIEEVIVSLSDRGDAIFAPCSYWSNWSLLF